MKKFFSLVLLCLILSFFAKAQNTQTKSKSKVETSTAQLGIKAGVNISNIQVGGNDNAYDSRAGFHIGALAHIHISDHFAVQPELMYSSQGVETSTKEYNENFINLPLLLQYMTMDGFRLQTGPQVGFLVSAKEKTGDVEIDFKDLLNKVDFSWAFGASYLSKIGLGLDVRYNLGISNRTKNDNSPETRYRVW